MKGKPVPGAALAFFYMGCSHTTVMSQYGTRSEFKFWMEEISGDCVSYWPSF